MNPPLKAPRSRENRSLWTLPKRLGSLALLGLTLFAGIAPHAQATVLAKGDPSGDRQVNVADAVLALQAAVGVQTLSPEQQLAADMNGDARVDVSDAISILTLALAPPAQDLAAAPIFGTARFHIDAKTGKVRMTSQDALSQPLSPEAELASGEDEEIRPLSAFVGSAVDFETSLLLDQPGSTGRKILSVALVNRSGEPMGRMLDGTVSGIKVMFTALSNLSAHSDLRAKTLVSTLAGSGNTGSEDGTAATAAFTPTDVAVGSDGAVYVTDTAGRRIRKIQAGQVSTLAGNGLNSSVDGSGTAASFRSPYGIAVHPVDGALYVADLSANKIRRVTPEGSVTTVAGTGAAGGANGSGAAATLNGPLGIAIDANGVIYVSELNAHRIRKIEFTGDDPRAASSFTVTTLAGKGIAGYGDGNGIAALFNAPREVAVDQNGVVYVVDTGNRRVRRITPQGEVVTIGGIGQVGSGDGRGNAASFYAPCGIAVAGESLVIADAGNHRLRQMTLIPGGNPSSANSWQVQTLAGVGTPGSDDNPGDQATFNSPRGLAADGSRNLYVADYGSRKARKVTPTNGSFPIGVPSGAAAPDERVRLANADGILPVSSLPYLTYGTALETGQVSAEKKWAFLVPEGVTAFEFNLVVEAATDTLAPPEAGINVGSKNVHVRTYAGGYEGRRDGTAAQARFHSLRGSAVDRAGNLFVGTAYGVHRIGTDGMVTTIAGTLDSPGAEDGPGHLARVNLTHGLAVTPDGRTLYVADHYGHTIRRIALTGSDPTQPTDWTVSTIAGLGGTSALVLSASNDNVSGDQARFDRPTGLALDSAGNLFLTEFYANRVRYLRFKGGDASRPENWHVRLIAGASDGASGYVNSIGGNARFNGPYGIAVGPEGGLYVVDHLNHCIRYILEPLGFNFTTTMAGSPPPTSGQAPESGYLDANGTSARFTMPTGIAADATGYLYVADSGNGIIRRVSPHGSVATVAGQIVQGSNDGTGDIARFYEALSIAADSVGNLYVTDGYGGTRVRLIQRLIRNGVP